MWESLLTCFDWCCFFLWCFLSSLLYCYNFFFTQFCWWNDFWWFVKFFDKLVASYCGWACIDSWKCAQACILRWTISHQICLVIDLVFDPNFDDLFARWNFTENHRSNEDLHISSPFSTALGLCPKKTTVNLRIVQQATVRTFQLLRLFYFIEYQFPLFPILFQVGSAIQVWIPSILTFPHFRTLLFPSHRL